MIKRVAHALMDCKSNDWNGLAVAAIEAMQEPTPVMIEAGEQSIRCGFSARYVWADMIKKGLE